MVEHDFDPLTYVCNNCGMTLQRATLDRGNVCAGKPPGLLESLRVLRARKVAKQPDEDADDATYIVGAPSDN